MTWKVPCPGLMDLTWLTLTGSVILSLEMLVVTSWRNLDFSGHRPKTVAKSSTLSASLVSTSLYTYRQVSESYCCNTNFYYFLFVSESGHALACLEHNATLQCGSGQVIEIDDSFYGRKTLHYCRAGRSLPHTSLQEECSWVDVVDMVSGMDGPVSSRNIFKIHGAAIK